MQRLTKVLFNYGTGKVESYVLVFLRSESITFIEEYDDKTALITLNNGETFSVLMDDLYYSLLEKIENKEVTK